MSLSRRDFLKLSTVGVAAWALPRPRLTARAAGDGLPEGVYHIRTIDPRFGVLLSVDDGYSETFSRIAAVIRRKKCPIAFFPMGRMLHILADLDGENLLETLVESGCIIGNHSYSHPYFTHLNDKQIAEELLNWEKALANALGTDYLRMMKDRFPYFRIPFGAGKNTPRVHRVVTSLGYKLVDWTWDDGALLTEYHAIDQPEEALKQPLFGKIVTAIKKSTGSLHRGDIALMHSNWWDAYAFEALCDRALAIGLADPETSLAGTFAILNRLAERPWGGAAP